jgi:hypothetical protein
MDREPYDESYQEYDDYEPEYTTEDVAEEYECPCGYYCFDCLGLSWNDFM